MPSNHSEHRGTFLPLFRREAPPRRLAAVLVGAALIGACDEPPGEDGRAAPAAELTAAPAPSAGPVAGVPDELGGAPEPVATAPAVCPEDRVIGVKTSSGDCHEVIAGEGGAWLGEPLLAGEQVAPDEALPPALRRLCEFRWTSQGGAPADLAAFDGKPYSGVEPDCAVNWPQGLLLDDALRAPLRDAFYQHVGRLPVKLLPPAARSPVSIALADTASSAPVDMNSDHALVMGRIIQSIACPAGGACPISIARHLALPMLEDGAIDTIYGGFHGSPGQLARAIFAAVETWRHTPGDAPRLLNLSLGWPPAQFGGLEPPSAMPGPARAVYRALQYAACNRVLSVAAAGNTVGDFCFTGPLAPAVWESHPGPDAIACAALFGAAIDPPPDIAAQPLVHAVAGVAYDDRPLQNALPGSRSRLAAPAFMAVADEPTGLTVPMTGSSGAAAAVTAIAALVWSYDSALTPGQVIQRIHASGDPLGPQAEFGVGGAIHRASACAALAYGCVGASCPPAPCAAAVADTTAFAAAADAALVDLASAGQVTVTDASAVDTATECPAACGAAELWTPQTLEPQACELDQVAGASRYTNPQPGWPTCSVCFLEANTLYMEMDSDPDDLEVSEVVLEVSDGVETQRHLLGAPPLAAAAVTAIELEQSRLLSPVVRATLHITLVSGETDSNAIPVL